MVDTLRYKDWIDKAERDIKSAKILKEHECGNDVSKKDKLDLDKEFMFSKDKNKKKRNKPNKKDEACDIISIWDDEEDNIDICEFSDKPPEGKVIRTFFTPGV